MSQALEPNFAEDWEIRGIFDLDMCLTLSQDIARFMSKTYH